MPESTLRSSTDSKIIVALDFATERDTFDLVDRLEPGSCKLKIGKELFTRCGPGLVQGIIQSGFDVFLDLKYHDIPNTVAKACLAAADLGVWMMNVHALGGEKMMLAAREAINKNFSEQDAPRLIAVTWLTSSGQQELDALGLDTTPEQIVQRLASMTANAGLDGVVCSAREATMLREQQAHDFLLVTPGIRPADASVDDQQRVVTPAQAISNGSSYLVIGRPITQATDPCQTLLTINNELG